eukprot:TRINITY_DN6108_c0_g1_i1.p1 TRINITY_DN6108_c0_g1~~TRINITY_DN6108_c0_g1_i1.p1  ORF type:complete len:547 (-),score=67.08 TRINITY_DN6108_c0_g1_i1:146-1786(-)
MRLAVVVVAVLVVVLCNGQHITTAGSTVSVNAQQHDVTPITVHTKNGAVVGTTSNGFHAFLGIPFAEPATGERRFSAPVVKAPWYPAVFDATRPGNCCVSGEHLSLESEDCLNLNVYVPANASLTQPTLPIMLWIYGGAFIGGCNSYRYDRPDWIANSTNTIVVSINYRLGAFGFLASNKLMGNWGIMDQSMAIQWVQTNIATFGGDKTSVTLVGQSAGAMSIGIHLTSPVTTKLKYFHSAIVESNPFALQYRSREQSQVYAKTFFNNVGCNYDDLGCLMNKTKEQILQAQDGTYEIPFSPKLYLSMLPWEPVIDNIWITDQPMTLVNKGEFYKLPGGVILGNVMNETLMWANQAASWLYNIVYGWEYDTAIYYLFGDHTRDILSLYPVNWDENSLNALARLSTDFLFVCATRNVTKALATHGVPTYLYMFSHNTPDNPMMPFPYCHSPNTSCHSAELIYVFNSAGNYPGFKITPTEQRLAWDIIAYWTSFIHTDRPSPAKGNPVEWPRFDTAQQKLMLLDVPSPVVRQQYHFDKCNLFDKIGYNF